MASGDIVKILENDPTLMTNIVSTRLGHKKYYYNVAYNGGVTPSVTSGTATVSSLNYGWFIPYQMQDGSWHCRFSISVNFSGATASNTTIVLPMNIIDDQYFNATRNGSATPWDANAHSSTGSDGNIIMYWTGTTLTRTEIWGDLALVNKPSWAY